MHLKTLEMIGFKSFSDKTTITFQPGVTAVVGPNGCGKSNISDAIRWVLGEQSAKHLRGDKMEDIIFNGSENRKPLGMAEVTLRLTNVGGSLSSEFGQYEEIEITRRLYRSGESEYLINKIPCRLKDIRDLMMDAGVGARIHAIIEQDKVEQILSSKPQDRRFLFEEVAGIMKYKARRQEALSKLESTHQNQLRVNDIIIEVKRQLNSLERQAKKAERYQKLRAEMKDLDYRLSSVDYSNLGTEWTAVTEEFRKAEDDVTGLHADLGRIESTIEESRADALSAEHELAALRHKIHETENTLSRAEHRVEMSRSQIASLTEQRGRDISEMEYLKQEAVRVASQKALHEDESRVLAASINEKNAVLVDRMDHLEALSRELREKELSLDETRTDVLNAMAATAGEKTRISNLQTRISQLDEQDSRGLKDKEDLEWKLRELTAHIAAQERELDEVVARKNAAQEEHARITERLEQALARKKSEENILNETKNRLAAQNSRLRSLIELEQSLEGYQKGVRTVMSAKKEGSSNERIGTIHGLVADMIETEPQYEVAIEAVLGERLQYVRREPLQLRFRTAARSQSCPQRDRGSCRSVHSERAFFFRRHDGPNALLIAFETLFQLDQRAKPRILARRFFVSFNIFSTDFFRARACSRRCSGHTLCLCSIFPRNDLVEFPFLGRSYEPLVPGASIPDLLYPSNPENLARRAGTRGICRFDIRVFSPAVAAIAFRTSVHVS